VNLDNEVNPDNLVYPARQDCEDPVDSQEREDQLDRRERPVAEERMDHQDPSDLQV